MIEDYFFIAIKNLKERQLRSYLTILGIFIAIATIFLLVSLSVGLSDTIEEQFEMLGTDKFFIQPRSNLGQLGALSEQAVKLTKEDVEVIEKVRGVRLATYFVMDNAKIEFAGGTRYFILGGYPEKGWEVFLESSSLELAEGKDLEIEHRGEVIVGYAYRYSNLFSKPVKPGDDIEINDVEYEVRGIMASVGNPADDQNIYMNIDDFEEQFNITNRADFILVQIQPGENINEVADRTKKDLMKFRDVTEKTIDFTVSTPEELLESFSSILNIVTVFLVGIAAISLIVGGIGIMNTMYTSVLERTKEIGTMKAVGAKNSDILLLFLIEAGLLGLVGGIIGIGVGFGGAKLVEYVAATQLGTNILNVYVGLPLIIASLAFSFIVGSLSGILPAYQASKLKPVDALRYE